MITSSKLVLTFPVNVINLLITNVFFKHRFDIKNTSCEIFVKHLNKAVMKC